MLDTLAIITRRVPRIRGMYHLYGKLRRFRMDREAVVSMRLGHRMIVDPGSLTEMTAFYEGHYDDGPIHILQQLIRPGEYVLDVGGNVGFYAIPLALAAERIGARVIAFEPLPANHSRLRRSAALNGIHGCLQIETVGLSSSERVARLTLREHDGRVDGSGNAAIEIEGYSEPFPRLEISLRPLDSYQLEGVGLIKVDIEGHEDEFLVGAARTIAQSRPIIFMEVNRAFYQRKRVDFDSSISGALPPNYLVYQIKKSRSWFLAHERIVGLVQGDISECEAGDIFLVPAEKQDIIRELAV